MNALGEDQGRGFKKKHPATALKYPQQMLDGLTLDQDLARVHVLTRPMSLDDHRLELATRCVDVHDLALTLSAQVQGHHHDLTLGLVLHQDLLETDREVLMVTHIEVEEVGVEVEAEAGTFTGTDLVHREVDAVMGTGARIGVHSRSRIDAVVLDSDLYGDVHHRGEDDDFLPDLQSEGAEHPHSPQDAEGPPLHITGEVDRDRHLGT